MKLKKFIYVFVKFCVLDEDVLSPTVSGRLKDRITRLRRYLLILLLLD